MHKGLESEVMLRISIFLLFLSAFASGQEPVASSQSTAGRDRLPVASQKTAPQKTATSSKLQATREEEKPELAGSLTGDNLYSNPALSMTLQLTGEWQIMDEKMKRVAGMIDDEDDAAGQGEAKRQSLCMDPLCPTPEDIHVGLITQTDESPSVILIIGFKLAKEYLDRERHPLKSFADMMLRDSGSTPGRLAGNGPTALQLAGRPVYRFVVHVPETESQEAGYIVESNGYLVLLVAVASSASDLPKFQAEIEGVQFK